MNAYEWCAVALALFLEKVIEYLAETLLHSDSSTGCCWVPAGFNFGINGSGLFARLLDSHGRESAKGNALGLATFHASINGKRLYAAR